MTERSERMSEEASCHLTSHYALPRGGYVCTYLGTLSSCLDSLSIFLVCFCYFKLLITCLVAGFPFLSSFCPLYVLFLSLLCPPYVPFVSSLCPLFYFYFFLLKNYRHVSDVYTQLCCMNNRCAKGVPFET